MTSSVSIERFTLFRIRGPVTAAVSPGGDPRPASGQAWLLARPRVITGRRQGTSRG